MVVVSISVEDFGSHMLRRISELERRLNIKLPLFEKILLVETGTVEQVLSILTNSETEVKILKQKESYELIQREIHIINKKTGEKLVYAKSNIIPSNLPDEIIMQIKRKYHGIGTIIISSGLETFRKILKIGYNSETRSVFRIYQIIYQGKVAFEIKEVFYKTKTKVVEPVCKNTVPVGFRNEIISKKGAKLQ
jgi:chorismate-pyruvate lyase